MDMVSCVDMIVFWKAWKGLDGERYEAVDLGIIFEWCLS